ncbi:hypothetical protein [Methylomonas sp. AM2-LC]|uniref:hypothetical protein n=1 Tax=Methylomonas sp. AM2-LC TaxID=3153301 RepID=UPI003266E057
MLKLFLIVFVLLNGCAFNGELAMTKQVQEKIEAVDVVLIIPQDQIDIELQNHVNVPGYTKFTQSSVENEYPLFQKPNQPVVGSGLAASINEAANQAILSMDMKELEPIITQLQNYDFRSVVYKNFSSAVPSVQKIKINTPVMLVKSDTSVWRKLWLSQSKSSAVLFVKLEYMLSSKTLNMCLAAEMYPKSNELLKLRKNPDESRPLEAGNRLYRNVFYLNDSNVTSENIKGKLADGSANIIKKLVTDLNTPL